MDLNFLFMHLEEARKLAGAELVHVTILGMDVTITYEKGADKSTYNFNIRENAGKGLSPLDPLRKSVCVAQREFYNGRIH